MSKIEKFALFTLIGLVLFGFVPKEKTSNTKYIKAMERSVAILDTTQDPETIFGLANTFERIGSVEKEEWLPLYYAALCKSMYATMNRNADFDKDEFLDIADSQRVKAVEIAGGENSELKTLEGLILQGKLLVDPMSRFQVYGVKMIQAFLESAKLDSTNPRPYLMMGTNTMFTPKEFGGGPDLALPTLKKAAKLYQEFKPKSSIHPNWGAQRCTLILAGCNEMIAKMNAKKNGAESPKSNSEPGKE